MKQLLFILNGWVMIVSTWLNEKFCFIANFFSHFDVDDIELIEHSAGALMNVLGAVSFIYGFYFAWKYKNRKKKNV